jgi:hypothetical protein
MRIPFCFTNFGEAITTSMSMPTGVVESFRKTRDRNGYYLYVELDFEKLQKHSICRQMTPEEWEQYMEWEQEE